MSSIGYEPIWYQGINQYHYDLMDHFTIYDGEVCFSFVYCPMSHQFASFRGMIRREEEEEAILRILNLPYPFYYDHGTVQWVPSLNQLMDEEEIPPSSRVFVHCIWRDYLDANRNAEGIHEGEG